ncbi:alpha/beta hydrolase family protein [Fibrella aquatilis]|uniref:Alpha/beta fold hydrolase n=1 Tax=Fibrella aquatilis TaxID=2817059 RepID=A0A939G3Y9_9BACT|nr:alpha/beta fold hydrolase [Fibrella aquatilis]MBO0929373.1 alpha/beta fold hydrolase [Fibrella aquatilis]
MHLFFKDPMFDGQLIRAVNHVYHNGADVGECMMTAARIREKDTESWYREWTATAQRIDQQAQASEKAGHLVSAREGYLKASNYYRTSYIFHIGSLTDPRVKEAYRNQRDTFRKAMKYAPYSVEEISIPYEKTFMTGYFFKVDRSETVRPTLIITGGYDCPAEEMYFFSAEAALRRGYNCLVYDGPGQGEMIIERGVPFRPDWEHVLTPVVDYLHTRSDVNTACIAQLGISFGGYLAPRAVTQEHRVSALIADPAQSDLYDAVTKRMPGFLLNYLLSDSRFKNGLANLILKRVLRDPVKGWSLRRGLAVHQAASVRDYIEATKTFTYKDRVDSIRCETLVCAAENDEIASFAKHVYDGLTCPKQYILFKNADGAGEHCEDGNRSLFNQRAFDWLDEVYGLAQPKP